MATRVVRESRRHNNLIAAVNSGDFFTATHIKNALTEYPKGRHKVGFNYRQIYQNVNRQKCFFQAVFIICCICLLISSLCFGWIMKK